MGLAARTKIELCLHCVFLIVHNIGDWHIWDLHWGRPLRTCIGDWHWGLAFGACIGGWHWGLAGLCFEIGIGAWHRRLAS